MGMAVDQVPWLQMQGGLRRRGFFLLVAVLMAAALSLAGARPAAAYSIPSVKTDYGAVGNGTTDDTTAFQNALNASAHIYVPPGTYRIASSLTLQAGSGLIGTPDAVILLDGAAVKLSSSGVNNLLLKDITIKRSVSGTADAIDLYNAQNVTIDGVQVIDNKSTGAAISVRGTFADTSETTGSRNILITNVLIKDYQRINTGGLGSGTNQGIEGRGIDIRFSKDFVISNNRIVETQSFFQGTTSTRYAAMGINAVSSIHGDIVGNEIDTAGYGIELDGAVSTSGQTTSTGMRGSSYLTVTGNAVNNMYTVGIDVRHGSSFNTVSSNVVKQAALAGILLAPGSNAVAYGAVVKGNIIAGNTVTDTGSGIGYGAWTATGSSRESGIALEPYENNNSVRVTQNVIIGNSVIDTKGRMTYGVIDSGVFGYSTPSYPYENRFAANYASGAITANTSINTTRNKNLTW